MNMTSLRVLIVAALLVGLGATGGLAGQPNSSSEILPGKFLFYGGDPIEGNIQNGFSGSLMVGGGVFTGDLSQDIADDDQKTISNLNQKGENDTEFIPLIIGDINYTFVDARIRLGMDFTNGPGAYVHHYIPGVGILALRMGISSDEVWADPYLTNTARSKTDMDTVRATLGWKHVFESPFSLRYGLESRDIDNDLVGTQENSLKREGEIHNFQADYLILNTGAHRLTTGLVYELADLDGKAEAYKGYGAEIAHVFQANRWDLKTAVSGMKKDFDGRHIKFNKTREDKIYTVDTAFTFYRPFGFDNYFISVFGAYTLTDSNIDFYESKGLTTGIGVGFTF